MTTKQLADAIVADFTAENNHRPAHGGPTYPNELENEAFHGIIGEISHLIYEYSESDLAAILIQNLVAFGNVVGRAPYFKVGSTRHGTNLFATLAGETASARKGTSFGEVKALYSQVDPEWTRSRVMGGLSSGEGLAWQVRDEVSKFEPPKKGEDEGRTVVVDPGVGDKRLLVFESEFASVLSVADRKGNTLTPRLRQAWDGDTMGALTKTDPTSSTDHHISVVAHITRDELLQVMTEVQAANGLFNRFLWICSRQSKQLPHVAMAPIDKPYRGFDPTSGSAQPLVDALRKAVDHARRCAEFHQDPTAGEAWAAAYGPLGAGRPGMLGKILSRSHPIILRIAMIYALLDCDELVHVHHLAAAMAVWRYAERSAAYIFGDRLGDRTADRILDYLRETPTGATRTDISLLFGKNKKSDELDRALEVLARYNLAFSDTVETEGRAAERWFAR